MYDHKTYYEKNKDKYKKSMQEYYKRNQDKLKVVITCKICNSDIQFGSLTSHIKTKFHNSFLPSGHNRTKEECYI
jgi:tRNA U34 2-thiouridine synthase MnmA/TrmU